MNLWNCQFSFIKSKEFSFCGSPDDSSVWLGLLHEMFGRRSLREKDQWQRRSEAYRTRVLSYLGDQEPIAVQLATPSQLDRRLRDVAPEELIRRPAPEKWSIAEIVAHLADAELAMGWRLRNMLAESGRGLNVVGSGGMGGAAWVTRSKMQAAFRQGDLFRGRFAREQPATVGVGPARTVGGVRWGPRGTRPANGRGVRPPGSGTRLEPSSAD